MKCLACEKGPATLSSLCPDCEKDLLRYEKVAARAQRNTLRKVYRVLRVCSYFDDYVGWQIADIRKAFKKGGGK